MLPNGLLQRPALAGPLEGFVSFHLPQQGHPVGAGPKFTVLLPEIDSRIDFCNGCSPVVPLMYLFISSMNSLRCVTFSSVKPLRTKATDLSIIYSLKISTSIAVRRFERRRLRPTANTRMPEVIKRSPHRIALLGIRYILR